MNNLLLLSLLSGFLPIVFTAAVVDNPLMATQYLMYFNYLKQSDMSKGQFMSQEKLTEGLIKFQTFANLTVTGKMDDDTMEKMNQPRCGVSDNMMGEDARKRRFAAQGRWSKTSLTWRIDNVTPDFGTPADIEQVMREALKFWSDVSGLTFTQLPANDPRADIIIIFAPFSHGDGNPFDGPGGTLAHAYFPGNGIGGDAHFDESETYSSAGGGINLLQVAVHEFGHSLGLGHSEVSAAVMAPFYAGYDPNFSLHPDDIAGIQTLYGPNVGVPEVTMRPETMPPSVPCSGKFDTITLTSDGSTYAFRGNLVFKLESTGIASGFPAEISSVFAGLPNDLDASVFWEDVGKTYFFKGDQYYRVTGTTVDAGYPRPISVWNGVPNDLDAAFVWSGNGRVYFIKGDQYYRYNRYSGRVDSGYPRALSIWRGLPSSIDSAMQWANSRTYFFSGEEYYRFDDRNFRVDNSYPRSTIQYWVGCGLDSLKAQSTPETGAVVTTPVSGASTLFIPSLFIVITSTLTNLFYL